MYLHDFSVSGASKYLGIFLGPSAGATQWSLPLEKWSARAATITDVGASAAIAANLYNSRAVTTMSYVAQLRPLPKTAKAVERKIVNRILRGPGNTFGCSEFLNFGEIKGPPFTSIVALAHAAAIRTATDTVRVWPAALAALFEAAIDALPLALVMGGSLSPPFWDEPPIVLFLFATGIVSSVVLAFGPSPSSAPQAP